MHERRGFARAGESVDPRELPTPRCRLDLRSPTSQPPTAGAARLRGGSVGSASISAIVGAGSAIAKDVAAGALAVTRAPQKEANGWADRFNRKRAAEKAAQKKTKDG